jgi:uncharacterized membrane protein
VTLVAANVEGSLTAGLDATVVPVGSALELAEAVHTAATEADVVVMTAAVADYRPAEVLTEKLKKDAQGERMTLELVRNPDVLADLVAARRTGQIIVGFAAETEPDRDARIELGRTKISRKPADLLVVNHVGWSAGFEREENAIEVLVPGGEVVRETSGTKAEVATAVLDLVATALTWMCTDVSSVSGCFRGRAGTMGHMRRRERIRRANRTATILAVALGAAGTMHFLRPTHFDRIVPEALPPRLTTLASGVAELGIAAGLAFPATRRASGWAAAALFAAVFPANLKMANDLLDHPRSSRAMRLIGVLRLPLQLPLVLWSMRVGRHAPKP